MPEKCFGQVQVPLDHGIIDRMGLNDFKKKHGIKPREVYPRWLTVKNGESVRVSFVTEPEGFYRMVEHASPDNWKKRAVCTIATGFCYGCEQMTYRWNQNIKLYIPVIHEGTFSVISQGIGANSVIHDLARHKWNRGTIRDVEFEVSRKGEGKRSAYTAVPTDVPASTQKTNVDITKLFNNIEYELQKSYYKE